VSDEADGPCYRPRYVKMRPSNIPHQQESSMGQASTIGLDLGKNVFQVHGIDAQGKILVPHHLSV
jgi:hypothetical protein